MNTDIIPTGFSVKNREHVYLLQEGLKTLGYSIDSEELDRRAFGAATKKALLGFKADFCLPSSIAVNLETVNALNGQLEQLYRLRGFVTNTNNRPIEDVSIVVYLANYENRVGAIIAPQPGLINNEFQNFAVGFSQTEPLNGRSIIEQMQQNLIGNINPAFGQVFSGQEIGRAVSLSNGSFCIFLNIPEEYIGKNGLLEDNLCIKVICYQAQVVPLDNMLIQDIETNINISSDSFIYTGKTVYQSLIDTLNKNGIDIVSLPAKEPSEIPTISSFTGINEEVIMKLMFSVMLYENQYSEAIFGYLYQSYPQNVPLQLFDDTVKGFDSTEWGTYKINIAKQIKIGLCLMPEDLFHDVLETACKQYIINNYDEGFFDFLISQKENLGKEKILEGDTSVFDIINVAVPTLTYEQKTDITTLFITNLYDFDAFIAELGNEDNRDIYGNAEVNQLLVTFQVSRVVRNFIPFLDYVISNNMFPSLAEDIRHISTISLSQWKMFISRIRQHPAGFNSGDEYAEFVYKNAQELYTDIAALSEIESLHLEDFSQVPQIKQFLFDQPDFNLLTTRIDEDTLTENKGIDFVSQLKTIQNVYRISPNSKAAAVMLEKGIKNSGQVYFIGKQQMEDRFKNMLSIEEIDAVYDIASARFSSSLVAFTNINQLANGVSIRAIQSDNLERLIPDLQREFPDIEKLFGDTDYCECPHDSSVYSAAAYLADLLHFLDNRKADNDHFLKYYFDKRRHDISKIYLNEHNTNTIMPYIDLVCEVLEEAVLKTKHNFYEREEEKCQSTLSSKELLAAPEHVLRNYTSSNTAYDIIKNEVYPMYAPLNLYQTEIRAYLEKMGIKRYQLMQTFQKDATTPKDVSIAAEYFGLTSYEQGIIAENMPDTTTRNKAWIHTMPTNKHKITTMKMEKFMRDSGLSAHETMDIVKPVVSPPNIADNWVKLTPVNLENCSVTDSTISGTYVGFDRAHRFIRLWRKSGWKIWELDLLLRSTTLNAYIKNGDNLNAKTLHNLMLFKQQQEELGLACENLLTFYDNINIKDVYENSKKKTALYDKLFLSKSLSNPVNEYLYNIKDKPNNTDAYIHEGETETLVAACLSISETDYIWLKNKYPNAKKLEFLSYLYRTSVLAKKLKISVQELFTVFKLIEKENNFTIPYTFEVVNEVITTCKAIKESKISISEYEYLLEYGYNDANFSGIALTAEQLKNYYEILKNELLTNPNNSEILLITPLITPELTDIEELEEYSFTANPEYIDSFTTCLSQIELYKKADDIKEIVKVIECKSDKDSNAIDVWAEKFFPDIASTSFYFPETLENKEDLIARYDIVVQYINKKEHYLLSAPESADIIDYEENSFAVNPEYIDSFTACLSQIELYKKADDIKEIVRVIECRSDKSEDEIDDWAEKFFSGINPELLYKVTLGSKEKLIARYNIIVPYINKKAHCFTATSKYTNIFTNHLSKIETYKADDIKEIIKVIECNSGKNNDEIDVWAKEFFPNIAPTLFYPVTLENKEDLIERYKTVIQYINSQYIPVAIKNHIAKFFDLAIGIVESYLEFDENSSLLLTIRNLLLSEDLEDAKINICKKLILIHKVALTIKKNDIKESDFNLLLNIQEKIKFDWFQFKTESTATPIKLSNLLDLSAMVKMQKSYGTKTDKTLFDIIKLKETENYDNEMFYTNLFELTKWDNSVITALCLYFGNILDFYKPETYTRINACMKMITAANVSVDIITCWGTREDMSVDRNGVTVYITESVRSTEIKNAAKAHYSIDAWLDELPALQKPIREAKADALASYLVVHSLRGKTLPIVWQDKIDLYGYFLLDTEMSACMKTSRIVQATLSVQLFVQRCLLNLENDITIDETNDSNWKHWDWMKKYRLWEANRKIFLYPENWIEPELRDDKTSFFKELEDELNQSDITQEHAETVFENYLQKLHTVSNLMVCGIYHEQEGRRDILHVVARTKSAPFEYYYRNYNTLDTVWSHWEKIDLDIKGDVVIPMMYNRKLHLFWLSTIEKSENQNNVGTLKEKEGEESKDPCEYTEIQLGWSVLKNKKWTGVKYSHKKLLQYGHNSVIDYSLVANYLEESNEVCLNVFFTGGYNVNLSGSFYFDGEVYRTELHLSNFTSDIKGAKENLNDAKKNLKTCVLKLASELAKMAKAKQSADKKQAAEKVANAANAVADAVKTMKEAEAKLKAALAYDVFVDLVEEMPYDTKPILLKVAENDEDNCDMFNTQTKLLASRLYSNKKDIKNETKNIYNIYLQNNTSNNLISTENQDPNIIQELRTNIFTMDANTNDALMDAIKETHLYHPFFYQDSKRSFFITPPTYKKPNYELYPFYHAYTNLFIKELNRYGIKGLLNRNIQIAPHELNPKNSFDFKTEYDPIINVTLAADYKPENKVDILDFNLFGAYSVYNWELFFHTPLYIACKLSQNQKYEEAMKWFHYIFNPMDKSSDESPGKFWIPKPFFEISKDDNRKQQIRKILENIEEHAAAVTAWLNNPYKPHLVARSRPVAYQRTVVMKYLDNLIAWADQLFRQDSMESTNEATLLYILAYEILGRRPVELPKNNVETISNKNYEHIANCTDSHFWEIYQNSFIFNYSRNRNILNITNSLFTAPSYYNQRSNYNLLQNSFDERDRYGIVNQPEQYDRARELTVQNHAVILPRTTDTDAEQLPNIDVDHFCIPYNDKLLSYWDIVEDRLFKLRNCMNIEGIVRELPLFEPPIDPAMLVKAAAAGLSIADALNDATAPQPYYRFRVILQKAIEFAGEVKQLGDKLLSALEKKDAETLNILRNSQEITMQQAMKQLRKLQIDEAKENVENINALIQTTTARKEYYESREYMNAKENSAYGLGIAANALDTVSSQLSALCAGLAAIPQFIAGFPVAATSFGGQQISSIINAVAISMSGIAKTMDKSASLLSTQAGYERRKEDWDFQAKMAQMELNQLEHQRVAAEIRLMMAEKELEHLEMQIEQSQSIKEYYQYKYTNEALYNWMITEISNIYFQSYKMAYDMAKKAEKCYCHELGIYDTVNFIQFDNWNSLKRGLLSGDKLIYDLHKLDAAYIDKNKRTLELTKHISLAQMFPDKLIKLITTGEVNDFELPEYIFDMDYPGHYMRRIKSVQVTIPNVAGPNTTVSFMLTLQSAKVRKSSLLKNGKYVEDIENGDDRFFSQTGGSVNQSICTSSAQNDSGMFELNFNDERYLPFEGAGVISKWKMSLPAGVNQFDLSSISDVILHINYTALYDGVLAGKAKDALNEILPKTGAVIFSPKQDFPDAWSQMEKNNKSMKFEIKTEHLPFYMRSKADIPVTGAVAVLVSKNGNLEGGLFTLNNNDEGIEFKLNGTPKQNGDLWIYKCSITNSNLPTTLTTGKTWTVDLQNLDANLDVDVEDIFIVFQLGEDEE